MNSPAYVAYNDACYEVTAHGPSAAVPPPSDEPLKLSTRLPSPPVASRLQPTAWLGALAFLAVAPPPGFEFFSALLRWPGLMLAPGAAIYLFAAPRDRRLSDLALFALVLSPVVTTLLAIAGLALRAPAVTVAGATAAISYAAAAIALLVWRGKMAVPARRSVLWLGALLLLLVFLTAYLPATRAWWRIRSDAWFHAAVVAQIGDYGIPPQDPYFAGLPLQYMWFYHVLVLTLSRGLGLDPFRVMSLVNIQALVAMGVAAWQLCGVFRRGTAHRLGAAAVLLLGFNGAFWVFLPVKLVKAVLGDVRGLEELRRTYSLHPFDYNRACDFMNVYYNQEFFLDKVMVATAFGLSLAFMVAAWCGAVRCLRAPRVAPLVLFAGSLAGMLGFHSLVGFVTLVGVFGGAALAWALRPRGVPFPARALVLLLGVSLAIFAVSTPYLHQVMHLKTREQVFPLSVSLPKTGGIFISCAFALALFALRRPLLQEATPTARFFLFGGASVALFCLLIALPGPNTYDKLGYLVFVPLSVPAGIALADLWLERTGRARAVVAAWTAAFMLPVNALAFAGCFLTPDATEVTPPEARLSVWLREHTPRNALILDDHDRVVFLVTVPRRYYWGCRAYADQWGYPRLEMSRRLHARRALYAPGVPDASALEALGSAGEPLFAIVRPEHRGAPAALLSSPDLFRVVHEDEGYGVVQIDGAACRAAAAKRPERVSPEELLRESGF